MAQFKYIDFHWIRRTQNAEANDLAQMASGYKVCLDEEDSQVYLLKSGNLRADIVNYLKDSTRGCHTRF
jgi:hypothetical protein